MIHKLPVDLRIFEIASSGPQNILRSTGSLWTVSRHPTMSDQTRKWLHCLTPTALVALLHLKVTLKWMSIRLNSAIRCSTLINSCSEMQDFNLFELSKRGMDVTLFKPVESSPWNGTESGLDTCVNNCNIQQFSNLLPWFVSEE